MSRILIIDDEKEIVYLMKQTLIEAGYEIETAENGEAGLQCALDKEIDLIILDIMMPIMDGMKVCEEIRKKSAVPIIMVSAKGQMEDKVNGLLQGADDYLVKPFSMEELLARVISQIRRAKYFNQGMKNNRELEGKGIVIQEDKHLVFLYGEEIKLTPTEYDILTLLMRNRGKVFSAEEIYKSIWAEKYYEGNNTVMSHMWRLREKIEEDPKNPQIIETVWGVGYKIDDK